MPLRRRVQFHRASPARPFARATRGLLPRLVLGGALAWLAPLQALAQSCWVASQPTVAFGEVGTGGKDTSSDLVFRCQRSFLQPTAFRVCLFLPEGSPVPGVNPRWMTNYNGAQMRYDLFSDAARTQVIGPFGSPFPIYSRTMILATPFTYDGTDTLPVYARAAAGQSLPATYAFQSQLHGGQLRYSYNHGSFLFPPAPPSAADCLSGGGSDGSGVVTGIYTGVSATFANTCRVTTATDLDFGSAAALPGNRNQTSTIQLQCPLATAWRVGLDNGGNATGNTRRMRGPGGNHLVYELYRDSGRTQRWGSNPATSSSGTGTNASQSLTVYGRVPAQPTPVPGRFSDTITVTLTY